MTTLTNAPRRADVRLATLARVLIKQADGPMPWKHLAVAVIVQAIADCRQPSTRCGIEIAAHHSAWQFIEGDGLRCWAGAYGLDVALIRRIAHHCADISRARTQRHGHPRRMEAIAHA